MTATYTLNNGVQMPAIGLGVFQTPPEETTAAVVAALATGYRHIDTAAAYGNEREVGDAIRSSGVDRSEVFIETKVWISDFGYDPTLHAFDKSAGKLGVDVIDLLILHQALPSAFDRTIAAYQALEKLLADGTVRAIGVSNFMPEHLDRLLEDTAIVPAVNQVEMHPYFTPARRPGRRRAARHPHPGLVTDRRHHLLPRRRWRPQHVRRPDHRRHRRRTRQNTRPGHVALAPAARPIGHPEVDQARAHRRELRRLRLRSHRRRSCDSIDALDTGVRGGPEPDDDHPRGVRPRHPRGLTPSTVRCPVETRMLPHRPQQAVFRRT